MRWSWKIGRIAGIELDVHATFVLLLAWVAYTEYQVSRSAVATLAGVVFTLAIFASVVLHELGHALTARRFGVNTRGITLLPIGGVARLERIPEKPSEELAIALAGPAVTVAIVVALYVALRAMGTPVSTRDMATTNQPFLAQLMWVNVWLAVFNMIPAFPMDGGRVLRALIALRADYLRATVIAARIGQLCAVGFAAYGLFYLQPPNIFLALIALFVWSGAAAEVLAVRLRTGALEARRQTSVPTPPAAIPVPVPAPPSPSLIRASDVMVTNIRTLAPSDVLAEVVDSGDGYQGDYPVLENGTVVGVLTREALLRGVAEGGATASVADVMLEKFATADVDEPLDVALRRMEMSRRGMLPVVRGREYAGALTAQRIGELAGT